MTHTRAHGWCQKLLKLALAPFGRQWLNRNRQVKKDQKTHNTQFAASAAVHHETGNFKARTVFEARPQSGVPKAFLARHTSACDGARVVTPLLFETTAWPHRSQNC